MASVSLPCHVFDLRGQRFGKLVVLSFAGISRTRSTWLCVCDCGRQKVISAGTLKRGNTRSCGCLRQYGGSESCIKHGHARRHGKGEPAGSGTVEYLTWRRMKRRCYNEREHNYRHYGGRGISVCDRWRNSFENFLADMGQRPSSRHSLDRIDVDGNYEPSNCRWATHLEQARNKRKRPRTGQILGTESASA